MTASGIYVIRNAANGHFYVGSSVKLPYRKASHFHQLRHGKHVNSRLQRAYLKYGADALVFEVIALIAPDVLAATETRLLSRLVARRDCYNVARDAAAPMRGRKATDAQRAKQSAGLRRHYATHASASLGKPLSDEHRAKIGASTKGKKRSAETRANMSAAQKGRAVPMERRAKLSAAGMGKKLSPESIAKRTASVLGKKRKPLSADALENVRAAARKRGLPREQRERMTAASNLPDARQRAWATRRACETET